MSGNQACGDPSNSGVNSHYLVAGISKAKEILDWEPTYNIKDIIQHAWEWENSIETSN